jgi:hypothetical protein
MHVDDHVKFVHVSDILVVLLAGQKKRSRRTSEYCINRFTPDPTSEESSEESDDSEDSANTDSENSTDMDSDCKSFSQGMSGRFKPQHAGKKLLKLSPLKSLSSFLFPKI